MSLLVCLATNLARMDESTHPSSMDLDDDVSSSSSSSESESKTQAPAQPAREYLLHKAKFTTTGRVIDSVKCPPMHPLAHEKLFDAETGKPNAAKLKKWFRKEGRLHKDDILAIVSEASAILRNEPNLLSVSSPITGTSSPLAFGIRQTISNCAFPLLCFAYGLSTMDLHSLDIGVRCCN